ncbi:MAG: alpha/beta family hydrolase [Ornithinimicrobium sp.]
MSARARTFNTTVGVARVHHREAETAPGSPARGTLVLGHGAGGGVESADLQALAGLAGHGWHTVLIEQPWRVAGRRIAVAPPKLDEATAQILTALGSQHCLPRPWVLGGRSAGARVACRLSEHAQACLLIAFPLVPRRRDGSSGPRRSPELMIPLQRGIPTLVVQGDRDRFGGPGDIAAVISQLGAQQAQVVSYRGDHAVPRDLVALMQDVSGFLDAIA